MNFVRSNFTIVIIQIIVSRAIFLTDLRMVNSSSPVVDVSFVHVETTTTIRTETVIKLGMHCFHSKEYFFDRLSHVVVKYILTHRLMKLPKTKPVAPDIESTFVKKKRPNEQFTAEHKINHVLLIFNDFSSITACANP